MMFAGRGFRRHGDGCICFGACFLIATLLVMLLAVPSRAADYYLATDGYYYAPGSTQAYTRTTTWTAGYSYLNGCCYAYQPGYYSYVYTPYVAAVAKPNLAYAPDWKIEHTKIAKIQVQADADFRAKAQDYAAYQESLKTLGLNRGSWGGYPLALSGVGYIPANSLLAGTFGYNTSTVYGYNPQSLAQTIDPFKVSLDQYFLQASQLASGAQDASKQATTGFHGLIDNAASRAADLSGIAARRDAIVAFSKLLDGPPVTTQGNATFKFGPGKVSVTGTPGSAAAPPPLAAADDTLEKKWNASANARCASCHYGDKGERKDGGWSVTDLSNPHIMTRLALPASDAKHMPKGGPSLPPDELQAWASAIQANAQQPLPPTPASPSPAPAPPAAKLEMPKLTK